ncbi:MAG: tetratricopeptide repeat protein [Actinobacteria bacterium]|nr:MAG: tetratricopeptide repeat protein [Actinomycetota bacterium]
MKINLTLPSARTVFIGVAAIVAAGLLVAGGWYWHATAQHRAMAVYAEAMTRAQSAQNPEATSETRAAAIRELEAALTQYPSGRDAAQVAYLLGNLRFQSQQYSQARGAFELAVAQGAPRTLRTLSRGGVAYTWEAERNYPKAVEAFKVALEGLGPKDFLYEELLLGLGRTQELSGQKAEATATYRRAVSELPNSRRLDEIKARLAELGT